MVAGRRTDLTKNILCQLREKRKDFVASLIATNENTDVTDIAQLAVFIRGVNEDFQLVVELLDLVPMEHYF
jgi:hypothetical protein